MNAPVKHLKETRRLPISEIARNMLEESGGDMNAATEKLANYAENFASYRGELLRIAARKLLHEVVQSSRQAILREDASFNAAPYRMTEGAKAAQARLRMAGPAIKSALLELEFSIGGIVKPLREWTGSEIIPHAEIELAKGTTAVRNARFLLQVGHAAGENKVGALPAKDVERMYAESMASPV